MRAILLTFLFVLPIIIEIEGYIIFPFFCALFPRHSLFCARFPTQLFFARFPYPTSFCALFPKKCLHALAHLGRVKLRAHAPLRAQACLLVAGGIQEHRRASKRRIAQRASSTGAALLALLASLATRLVL